MSNLVIVEYETPEIVIATLNRPEKRNALNIAMMQELLEMLEQAERDPKVRVLILNGKGKVFCSGLDLDEAVNHSLAETSTEKVAQILTRLNASRLVTIALPHGAAMAGGAGLVAACDIAVGTPEMRIGFPEVKRGLIPALISILLSRQVGWRNLRELFLLGSMISGTQAVELGLLNRVIPEGQLREVGLMLALQVLEGSPKAIEGTKKLLNYLYSKHMNEEILYAHQLHLDARNSSEAIEGIRAFQEDRKPNWTVHS